MDLSEADQESLKERGINPEDINFEGTDLEKEVTNKDTLVRQWEEFMDMCHKDAGGQLPENKKDNFLIVDFWENFEHFNMMPKDENLTIFI